MSTFNTIHIFGFGDTQIIKEDLNNSIKSSELTSFPPFVNAVLQLKPENIALAYFHVIHIFQGDSVKYIGGPTENRDDVTNFTIEWENVPLELLDALVTEIEAKIAEETPTE